MSSQLKSQANKLWQTITESKTTETYQQTFALTWSILKEAGYLLWLVVCLGLVFGEWVWKTGYRTGWQVRGWVNNLSSEEASADQVLSDTGKSLLEVGKSTAAAAIASAKEQLGLENKPEPPLVPSTPPAPKPASAPPPTAPTPPVVTADPPAADPLDE